MEPPTITQNQSEVTVWTGAENVDVDTFSWDLPIKVLPTNPALASYMSQFTGTNCINIWWFAVFLLVKDLRGCALWTGRVNLWTYAEAHLYAIVWSEPNCVLTSISFFHKISYAFREEMQMFDIVYAEWWIDFICMQHHATFFFSSLFWVFWPVISMQVL